jgi:acetyl esterase
VGRDPEYLALIREIERFIANTPPRTIEEIRAADTAQMAGVKAPDVPLVVGLSAAGVPVRLYHPSPGTPRPALVFFHGGGFYTGSVAGYDPIMRMLVHATGCAMVSVDYRLAPEHPFPAGVHDALTATADIAARTGDLCLDATRLGVAGDSAGANLATVVARHLRGLLALQLLVYGVYDLTTAPQRPVDPDGIDLGGTDYAELRRRYLAGADARNPDASPLLATDLAGGPPAILATAEYDRLTPQSDAYALRLREAGVPVTEVRGDGLDHAFLNWGGFARRPAEAIERIGAAVRQAFALTDSPAERHG